MDAAKAWHNAGQQEYGRTVGTKCAGVRIHRGRGRRLSNLAPASHRQGITMGEVKIEWHKDEAQRVIGHAAGSALHWSKRYALFTKWWQRIRSRYEVEQLSDRDLADMGLTRLDAFNQAQKPFWEA
jgi:uncharacterized protein YjiS (DUF1127 family)